MRAIIIGTLLSIISLSFSGYANIICKGSFSGRSVLIAINEDIVTINYDFDSNTTTVTNLTNALDDHQKGLYTAKGFSMIYQLFSGKIINAKVTTLFKHRYRNAPSLSTIDVLCEDNRI